MVFNISHATWPQRVGLLFCFFGLSRVNHVNDTPNHLFARFWNPINTVYSLYLDYPLSRTESSEPWTFIYPHKLSLSRSFSKGCLPIGTPGPRAQGGLIGKQP